MKVYSISKWAFRAICLLIILLPVGRHWILLTTGERCKGTVTEYVMQLEKHLVGEDELVYASEIEFEANGTTHKVNGPHNYEYKPGRRVTVFYDQESPSDYCIATFSWFYLNDYIVLPIVLLTLWAAFYMSFNNYRKRMKMPKGGTGSKPSPAQTKRILKGVQQIGRELTEVRFLL